MWTWESRAGFLVSWHGQGSRLLLLRRYHTLSMFHFIVQGGCSNSRHLTHIPASQGRNGKRTYPVFYRHPLEAAHNIPLHPAGQAYSPGNCKTVGQCSLCSRHPCGQLLLRKKGRAHPGKQIAVPLTASKRQTAANREVRPYNNFTFHCYCWTQDLADLEGSGPPAVIMLTAAPPRQGAANCL